MVRKLALALPFALSATLSAWSGSALAETRTAIFAGGCFWCVESDFDHVRGVISTVSGYIGGKSANPTYKTYVAGGHREAVKITYDSAKVSYDKLLDVFWHSVDPTDAGGQFCDRGKAYSTAIYAVNGTQRAKARKSKSAISGQLKGKIVTPIVSASKFWPAEEYHQNYYKKKPVRYKYYRFSCGRDKSIDRLWGSAAHRGITG